ncbi:MAG: phosphoribosylanthranilate isomerase [Geminicoccaceae bacterium]
MRVRVKICCIETPEAAARAIRHGADALGLVGPMPSGTGIIDLETAGRIARCVPPPVATFLLSSAIEPEELVAQCRVVTPTALQIVDAVDSAAYALLRRELPALKLVQVVHVTSDATIAEALSLASEVDALLLDSGDPDAPVRLLGGTGKIHDWSISRKIVEASPVPVFLAGGLTPTNVGEAIGAVRPFGVDLCTGLRTEGKLDEAKLAGFMRAVSAASLASA